MITRKLDPLGRIVIPKEIRKEMNLQEFDKIEIHYENSEIKLKKHEEKCIFCGNTKNLKEYKGKMICHTCWEEI